MNIDRIIEAAMREDRCDRDITTNILIPPGLRTKGVIYAKGDGVIAGLQVTKTIFCYGNAEVQFTPLINDGDGVHPGQGIAKVEGDARTILSRERVALNFLQHLSGIATATRQYVKAAGLTKVLDTRKTTPGLRELEKYAVRIGGGHNHRSDLSEMVLIKDNHITLIHDIKQAVTYARQASNKKVEVEVKTIEQFKKAVKAKPDRIMLDNMTLDQMREAINIIRTTADTIKIEASGGIILKNLPQISELGLDFVSCGALTHSIKALDISLELVKES
ncbi:carboxylating nicotinate-nucleotide diphosphorylase [[Eubacterium] cellulosolvens]